MRGLLLADGVGRLPVVHPDQDKQLPERKARERHADGDARCHEKEFGDYGHAGRPKRKGRADHFASLADVFGGVGSGSALFLPRQLHWCVALCLAVTDPCAKLTIPTPWRGVEQSGSSLGS